MKLQDLDALQHTDKIAQILESRLGHSISFSKLSPAQSRSMLERVQGLINEHKQTPEFHRSERDPGYLKLIMLEQGLQNHLGSRRKKIREQEPTVMLPVSAKDPKFQQTMKKAQTGQQLTPDEQKTVTAVASQAMPKESRQMRRRLRESELQSAQVVLAAQDMIDRVQKMLEEISEMQFKDLPALTDSIKNDMGVDQATQFQSAASAALTQLLTSVQQGKTQMEGAQGVLTGQAPIVPGQDSSADAELSLAGDEDDLDIDVDADLDAAIAPSDEEEPTPLGGAGLGRERRDVNEGARPRRQMVKNKVTQNKLGR
jgi:hypothetical protein